ncbi:MAG: aspartate racemase, partial [Bacteroidota bacterium]
MVLGKISDTSRKAYQRIITAGAENGAEGAILGCTEIPLLIQQEHVQIPVFETTRI